MDVTCSMNFSREEEKIKLRRCKNITEIRNEVVGWIRVTQDGVQCRSVINATMNVRVPLK
jgi:hypothetical protein